MEAIILAGGLGTRLRTAVSELPKAMAPIHGRPFLEILFDFLIKNGVDRLILSVGYKSEAIKDHFGNKYRDVELVYSLEETQLGTGGAVALAMAFVQGEHVIVANGDSFFLADFDGLIKSHLKSRADISLSLKPMKNFSRYGTVILDGENRIKAFEEKRDVSEGIINGGLYVFNTASFMALNMSGKFSLERDVFENKVDQLYLNGFITDGYFIDIGIPADFQKAQIELGCLLRVNKDWTLFLDRDGVINKKIDDDYVRSIDQFELLPSAVKAIVNFSKIFGRIVIVTNQQGVGKGLMTSNAVEEVHEHLVTIVQESGGRIDAVYYAPQLEVENSEMRKPGIGMAKRAQKEFPEIDFRKSIMVGDSKSDMEFAERADMAAIFVSRQKSMQLHYTVNSLWQLSENLDLIRKAFL